MSNPWIDELWRAGIIAAVALLLGLVFGQPWLWLLLAVSAYLGWHLRNLARLVEWLRVGRRFHPPESSGIWDEVFQQIYRLQQRNRQRKRKLGSMLNRFQQATAAMPDATVVLTPGDEIEWWNQAAERLLGLSYPRDTGQRISNLLRHPAFVEYLARGDYAQPLEMPSPADEHVGLSIRIVPYGNNQRLLIARDISRIQRLEQMRRDFVANVSHELRTPLTVLAGYLETLDGDAEEADGDWRHALPVLRQQTERMQRIVEDLLMLSRLETDSGQGGQEPVSVPAMLAVICDDARRLSDDKRHEVLLEADPELWLRGNDHELRSLFSNLIFNAVRYTPAGGRIRVRWYQEGGQAVCAVSDTGIGIAPQHIPRLTERFYRIDVGRSRQSGGTGLGLAIVKHVLLRHQGELGIQSEPGKGSTFSARFPAGRVVRVAGQARAAE
ncbi:phosphate regulon sensor histidine kinase PhoR [Thiohalobacter sp. IOR34]|uniref:phosphate regulon sensor histidine kinase PhoR n=1 Tax=Thiohalobacter sp. IOR34 TaxID=3057176 RepID=UPI0025B2755E|nr:phosphate regulon sensor histidine kinase PhoR [Thiohalobacter sp. IOR34]WJW75072.1 phosphate regulon sensor histidine kinase PhoR [Thiohalobacter sp. IOR34]